MLWPIVLPFFLTAFGLLTAHVAVTRRAPRWGWPSKGVFRSPLPLAMVSFLPTWFVVTKVTTAMRLGVGRYEDVGDIWDVRFKRWLPSEATDIVLNKHIQGYDARFQVDRAALDVWFDEIWNETNANPAGWPVNSGAEPAVDETFDPAESEQRLGSLARSAPRGGRWIKYEGPRRSNGAGATTWYDEGSGTAYQDVGFW